MNLELENRTVLVTGASAGIGRSTAATLLKEGARVAVLARRGHLLQSLADELPDHRNRILLLTCDLTSDADRRAAHASIVDAFGHLDVLVNNAGYSSRLALDAPDELWRAAFELNFHAIRQLTDLFLPGMIRQRSGRIINVTGSSEPLTLNAASAAKAAVHDWAKGLSRDVGRYGITVNNVPPGRIHSEQIDERLYSDAGERDRFTSDHIPLGYFGDPQDVACLIAFLAGSRAGYITGQTIAVDGGMQRSSH